MTGEAMRLGTDGGARIDLRIVDYQYPEIAGDGTGENWDANWLVVAGDAVAEDGRGWSFLDPCLTTWEARELGDWLRGVVDGSVTPTPLDGDGAGRLLAFTEPNLAFSFADRTDDAVVVQVYLSLESGPPWPTKRGDYFLLVTMQGDAPGACDQGLGSHACRAPGSVKPTAEAYAEIYPSKTTCTTVF